jgi:acyl-CoA dehydrogenase
LPIHQGIEADYLQGPDEVHVQQIGKQELKRVPMLRERYDGVRKREAELYKQAGMVRAKL